MTTRTPGPPAVFLYYANERRARELDELGGNDDVTERRQALIDWTLADCPRPLEQIWGYPRGNGWIIQALRSRDLVYAYSDSSGAVIARGELISAGTATAEDVERYRLGTFTGLLRVRWLDHEHLPYDDCLAMTGFTTTTWGGYGQYGGVIPGPWLRDRPAREDSTVDKLREANTNFLLARTERRNAMLAAYDAGVPVGVIAAAMDLSHEAVRKAVRKARDGSLDG